MAELQLRSVGQNDETRMAQMKVLWTVFVWEVFGGILCNGVFYVSAETRESACEKAKQLEIEKTISGFERRVAGVSLIPTKEYNEINNRWSK